MMRAVAMAMLSLYPKPWRDRYFAEVADLIASRPVRLRTMIDLIRGAADAWSHGPRRSAWIPLAVVLAPMLYFGAAALWFLWNPGVRDVSSLWGVWTQATAAGESVAVLPSIAKGLFVSAGATGMLSLVPLTVSARAVMRSPVPPAILTAARRTVLAAPVLAVPAGLFGYLFCSLAFAHIGYPVGPFGDAMTGGFYIPTMLALVLVPATIAAYAPDPVLAGGVRGSGHLLAVAAGFNALGWVPVAVMMVLGLGKASPRFVVMVSVSALISVTMAALVATGARRFGREVPGLVSPRSPA